MLSPTMTTVCSGALAVLSLPSNAEPPNLPDLQIDYVTLDDDNVLVVAISNDADSFAEVPAGIGLLRVFVDQNKVVDEPLASLGDQSFLQIGGQTVVSTGIRLSGQARRVLAFVDPDNEIEELDEFQNRMSLALDAEPSDGYDFAVLARVRAGQLEISLSNEGSVASPDPVEVGVRVFVDGMPHSSFANMLDAVEPGDSIDVVPPVAILVAEPVRVRVTCRASSHQREHDEANNVFEGTLREVSFNSVVSDYAEFLSGHIGEQMYWEGTPSFAGFRQWPRPMRDMLIDYLYVLELGWRLPIQGPPEVLHVNMDGGSNEPGRISAEDARQAYVAHVAHSLWFEKRGGTGWSIDDLTDEELAWLFDSRTFLYYRPSEDVYNFSTAAMGIVTAWNPQIAFDFLRHADILAYDSDTVAYRLGDWIRSHCIHYTDQHLVRNRVENFRYIGFIPFERVPFPLTTTASLKNLTIGCWGTSGLIGASLRTINIPVVHARSVLGMRDCCDPNHSRVELPTITKIGAVEAGITIHHSDDVYAHRTWGPLSMPTWELFYSFDERDRLLTDPDMPLDCREGDPNDCNRYGQQTKHNFERFIHLVAREYLPGFYLRALYSDEPHVEPLEEMLTGPYVRPFLDEHEREDFVTAARARITEFGDGDYDAGVEILRQLGRAVGNRIRPDNEVPPGENRPPTIQPLPDQHVDVFDDIMMEITASDDDGDDVELGIIDPPPGSTFENGVFEWNVGAQAGIYKVVFTASDGRGGVASTDVVITVAGAIWRASIDSSGEEGEGSSRDPGVSAEGRFVVFTSAASNLVENDLNDERDIFVHDRDPDEDGRFQGVGVTAIVSVASDGTLADSWSASPDISADGRIVAFESRATTLVPDDTNMTMDVFVRDVTTEETWRVSVDSAGLQANGESGSAKVSADGRFVAFVSAATNLVDGDTNETIDVFVHDCARGETRRVSVRSDGGQANDFSRSPSISADGRFIAFHSSAYNLVDGDLNDYLDVFVHDRVTGDTTRVSIGDDGSEASGPSYGASVSADGRFVAFASEADNLVSDDTNGSVDVFVRDRVTGRTTRMSVRSGGGQSNGDSAGATISAQGRYVAFYSLADNLVSGDTNGAHDVFIHGADTGQTVRASVGARGEQADDDSFTFEINAISGGERYVVFQSDATNLVANDTNGWGDIFVRRLDEWRQPLGGDDAPPSRLFVEASISDDRGVPPGTVLAASGIASYGTEPVVFGTVTVETVEGVFQGSLDDDGTFNVEFSAPETDGFVVISISESVYGLFWSERFIMDVAEGEIPTMIFVEAVLSVNENVPPGIPIEVSGTATYDVDNDGNGELDPVTEGFVLVENGEESTLGELGLDGTFLVEFPAPCEDRNVEVIVHETVYGLEPGIAELPIDIIPVFVSTTWLCGDGAWSDSGCWSELSAGDDYPDIDCSATYDVYLPPGSYTVDVGPPMDDAIVVQELIVDDRADLDVGTAGDLTFTVDERLISLGTIIARSEFSTSVGAPAVVDESSLIARAGGSIFLPTVTHYAVTAMDGDRFLESDGFDSFLGLPALASIVNGDDRCCDDEVFVTAINGGEIDLSALQSASGIGGSRGDVIISVRGPTSVIQLPQLAALNTGSSLTVADGGTANTSPEFTTLFGASLAVSGASSTIDLSGLSTILSSTLQFEGPVQFELPLVLDIFDSRFTISGNADIDLANVVSIDQAGIRMGSGSSMSLPLVTSYSAEQMNDDRYVEAAGPGSHLGLPALVSIVNNNETCCDKEVFVRALDGGTIDLSSLRFVTGVGGSRGDVILSVGPTATIELQALNALNPGSSLTVEDGGTANTSSQLMTLLGTTLTINGPNAHIDLSGVSTITSSTLTFGNGTEFEFPLVLDVFDSRFSIEGTAEIDLSNVVSFDQASIRTWDGSEVTLPLVTSYAAIDMSGYRFLTADGPDSHLGFPALETIVNDDDDEVFVTASNGGQVDLSSLRSTMGIGGNRGDIVLTVSGPSTMHLDSLMQMNHGTIARVESNAELELPSDLMLSSMQLSIGSGCRLIAGGDFRFDMTNPGTFSWATTSRLELLGGTGIGDCQLAGFVALEVGGDDLGHVPEGFSNNFEIEQLVIGADAHVKLIDEFDNAPLGDPEALYVDRLQFADADGRLVLNGVNLYYNTLVGGAEYQIVAEVRTGDVDCSGVVDFGDILRVLAEWGPCSGCPEDINGDGIVDFEDILLILQNWGSGGSPPAAEELLLVVNDPADVAKESDETADAGNPEDVFVNNDLVAPRDHGGLFELYGAYRQTESGRLVIHVDGPVPLDEHDLVVVGRQADLDGALSVEVATDCVAAGDELTIVVADAVAGCFAEVECGGLPEDVSLEVEYGNDVVRLHFTGAEDDESARSTRETVDEEADLTGDGVVDVRDVLEFLDRWDGEGAAADIDRDGIVTGLDLMLIVERLGRDRGGQAADRP